MRGSLRANFLADFFGSKAEKPWFGVPLLSEATKTRQAGQIYLQMSYFKILREEKISPTRMDNVVFSHVTIYHALKCNLVIGVVILDLQGHKD